MSWLEIEALARSDWARACREARVAIREVPASFDETRAKIRFMGMMGRTRCGAGLGWVAYFNFSCGGDVARAEERRQWERERKAREALASRPLSYGTWSKGTPG